MRPIVVCLALAAPLLADEIAGLDPANQEDRARLVAIVEDGSADRYRAARKLVKAGHVEPLLDLLKTTGTYNAMQVVCATVGERSVPVMEERLARDPDNAYLVGSLAPLSDPRVTRLALRALGSGNRRTARAAAHKLIFAADVDGLNAELRRRFEVAMNETVRAKLAMCLLRRGDATPIPWIRENLADALDELAFVACANLEFPFEDASVVAPLLPDLIGLLGTRETQDAHRTLVRLTRHEFGKTREAWQVWYDRHKDRPLVYTKALHERIKKCAEAFRDAVHELGHRWCRTNPGPRDGGPHLWCVANPKEVSIYPGMKWEDGTPVKRPRFQIQLCLSLQTNASKMPDTQLELKFDELNVVARLRIGEGATPEDRKAVISAARKACEALR